MSANTGVAPVSATEFAVAAKVNDGTMTSSPGPTPAASRPRGRPAVPELTATTGRPSSSVALNASSNEATSAPCASIPERSTASTAARSSSPMIGLAGGMNSLLTALPSGAGVGRAHCICPGVAPFAGGPGVRRGPPGCARRVFGPPLSFSPMAGKRVLCISSSDINRDSRVLRQLEVLAELGEVTTVAYGEQPPGATEHLRVEEALPPRPQPLSGGARLPWPRYDAVELTAPAIREVLRLVGDRRFDLVVANEARSMGVAHEIAHGAPVLADLHEWAAAERAHVRSWRLLVKPFMTYQCGKYLSKMSAVTVVNDSIGAMYTERFGVRPRTVRNAGPFRDLEPSDMTAGRIRLVHSGGAVPGRNIEAMIEAVRTLDERFSLDMY